MDVKTRTESDLIALVPAHTQASGKYCVIVWSKSLKRTIFKINFSNKVFGIYLTDKDLVVVLKSQINVYDLANFALLFKKEVGGTIVQTRMVALPTKHLLLFTEDKVRELTSRHPLSGGQPLQKFRGTAGQSA